MNRREPPAEIHSHPARDFGCANRRKASAICTRPLTPVITTSTLVMDDGQIGRLLGNQRDRLRIVFATFIVAYCIALAVAAFTTAGNVSPRSRAEAHLTLASG
jgi:uncharacterized membrane protein